MGYPTANISFAGKIDDGVYLGYAKFDYGEKETGKIPASGHRQPSSCQATEGQEAPVAKHGRNDKKADYKKTLNYALPSLIFIGAAVTFGETKKFAEAHILDFKGELYGKKIELELVKKIRENIKFKNSRELVRQMKEDEIMARKYFG